MKQLHLMIEIHSGLIVGIHCSKLTIETVEQGVKYVQI